MRWILTGIAGCAVLGLVVMVGIIGAIVGQPVPAVGFQPSANARDQIPPAYLRLCMTVGEQTHLDWAVLCAIASVESGFGKNIGPSSAGAEGPCQFLPSTWALPGIGKGGDILDPVDCIPAMARYLIKGGAPADYHAAVMSYNHAEWYVTKVLAQAAEYRDDAAKGTVVNLGRLPSSGDSRDVLSNQQIHLSNDLERADLERGMIDPRVVALLNMIGQNHAIIITALRSDHSHLTRRGTVSNHSFGRAVDIGSVDGEICRGTPEGKCGKLAEGLARVTGALHPTELIYCYDVDGPGPAFAAADHCDHVHAGFNG